MSIQISANGLPPALWCLEFHQTPYSSPSVEYWLHDVAKLYSHVSLAVHLTDAKSNTKIDLPHHFNLFTEKQKLTVADAAKARHWIMKCAFQDLVSQLEVHLAHSWLQGHLLTLIQHYPKAIPLTNEQAISEAEKEKRAFHNDKWPSRLKKLEDAHLVRDYELKNLKSLIRIRNCYVHRNGHVTQMDTNGHASLKGNWRVLTMSLLHEDGTSQAIPLGEKLTGPTNKIKFLVSQYEKEFPLRSTVVISTEDMVNIFGTIAATGAAILERIKRGLDPYRVHRSDSSPPSATYELPCMEE